MSTLRSLRLLGSVESGNTLGPVLNDFLEDSGRLSEFHVLLSMRGQARRMAASTTTMTAIIASPIATNAVFADTNINNPMTAKAIVANQTAITTVSNDPVTLNIIFTNPISKELFVGSSFYESRIKEVVANLADLTPTAFTTAADIVTNPSAVASVVSFPRAMASVVASVPTMTAMAGDPVSMGIVASDPVAVGILANSANVMPVVAGSVEAMSEIAFSPVAMEVIANSKTAVQAIAADPIGWNIFSTSSFFNTYDKTVLLNIIGVDPSEYNTFSGLLADANAVTSISNNLRAVETLASNSVAMASLAASPNLGIILNSQVAMSVIGTSEQSMTNFINTPSAMIPLFTSSIAKGFMFTDALIDLIASNTTIIDYMKANAIKTTPASLRTSTTVRSQPFDGIPSRVILLSLRANNIGAIAATFIFGGSTVAGTGAGDPIGLKGTVIVDRVGGYIDPTWGVGGIAATAAAWPEVSYYDMS
jgi:hypothetical protein